MTDEELEARVKEVLAGLEKRPVPLGGFRRLFSLGAMQASLMTHYSLDWLRSFFRDRESAEQERAEVHLRAALQVLSRMGYLRGLVLKLGQVLGSYPALVPEQWARVLTRLQWEAPPMHFSLVREQLRQELGGEPEEVFAEFDRKAFAAASLGQVHRARLKSGEEVAVKIQYPGIARTIQVDLRNLRGLMQPLRLAFEWAELSALIEDLAVVAEREADYTAEAEYQRRAREVLAGNPRIRVPEVYSEHSSERVLVTELRRGLHLEPWLETDPPQELRDRYGELIFEGHQRLIYGARLVYPDANAGNLLFEEDGTLTLLDFGNMRALSQDEYEYVRDAQMAMLSGDEDQVLRAVIRGATIPEEEMPPEVRTAVIEFARWTNAPFREDRPFQFDLGFWQKGLELAVQSARIRFVQILPVLGHLCRAVYGGRALTTRLGACSNLFRVQEPINEEYGLTPG